MRMWGAILFAAFLLSSCQQEKTKAIGQVEDCGSGMYFSLQDQVCRPLKGHSFLTDPYGFERITIENGLTVPKKINGTSPFIVSFRYNVSQATSFDIVVKRLEFGEVKGDAYTDWEKVKVPAGEGEVRVRLFPSGGVIPPGGPAQRVEEQWQEEEGYLIEVKGGDRFENEDSDNFKSWRVAGLDVDPSTPDDPDGKVFIMQPVGLSETVQSCDMLSFELSFQKTDIELDFVVALKEPAHPKSAWYDWGSTSITVPAGTSGKVPVQLVLQDKNGTCPPAGRKVNTERWDAVAGAYVIQIDAFDQSGKKLNLSAREYGVSQSTIGVNVAPPLEEVAGIQAWH